MSSDPSRYVFASLVFALLALWSVGALAEESWTAPHERGVSLYRDGDYASALEAFEEARRLGAPAPNLYNLARSYQHLGRHREALSIFDEYLAQPDLPEERRRQAQEHRDRSASQLANLELRSAPPGAEVTVQSDAFSDEVRTPATLLVPPGLYRVTFQLGESPAETRELAVSAGQSELVEVSFPGPTTPEPPLVEPQPEPQPPETAVERGRSPWPWVLFGSGLAVAAAGAVFWGVAYSWSQRTEPFDYIDEYNDWSWNTHDFALIGDVLVSVGAAAALSGLIWLIIDRLRHPEGDASEGESRSPLGLALSSRGLQLTW